MAGLSPKFNIHNIMKRNIPVSVLFGAALFLVGSTLHIQAELKIGFEQSEGYTVGKPLPKDIWMASESGVAVTVGEAPDGGQSIEICGESAWVAISEPVFASREVSFLAISVKPVVAKDVENSLQIDTGGIVIGFAGNGETGRVLASDQLESGSVEWRSLGYEFALNQDGQSNSWLRLVLRRDAASNIYDVYVGQNLVGADLRLISERNSIGLTAVGGIGGSASLDNVAATNWNPLFEDSDSDGISDLFERRNGFDPSVNDRDWQSGTSGLTNLELFMSGGGNLSDDPMKISLARRVGSATNPLLKEFEEEITLEAMKPLRGEVITIQVRDVKTAP